MTVTTGNEMQIEIESDQQWMCHNLSKVTVGTQDAAGMWHCSDGHFRDAKGRTAVEGYQAGDFMNFMGGPLGATLKKLCEYAPINPATGEPYFSIPADGWGSGWSAGPVTHITIDKVGDVSKTTIVSGSSVNYETGDINTGDSSKIIKDVSELDRTLGATRSIHVTENDDGTKRVCFKDENSRIVPGSVKFNGHPVPDEAVNFESGEIDFTKFEEGRKHLAQQMVGFVKGAILNADENLFGSCTGTDSRVEVPGYELLADVLDRAYDQAARGKGHERHSNGEPFDEQVMQDMARRFGVGSLLGQAFKKSEESQRLPHDRAIRELLGSINYLAGAVIFLEAREAGEVPEF